MARTPPPVISDGDAGARAWAARALEAAGLCALSTATDILAARAPDGALLGVIGLEGHGRDGLLRSLVVAPAARRTGTGAALVAAVEQRAATRGLRALYLLTESATPFFSARGYEPVSREAVPCAVRASEQFRLHCPASAVCLRKAL